MCAYHFPAEADQASLLDRIKIRDSSGAMRHPLCVIDDMPHAPAPRKKSSPASLKYQWMYADGMGDAGFDVSTENDARAAEALIASGHIVPTFQGSFYTTVYRPLRMIEDVSWGFRTDGSVVLFELALDPALPDGIITPDTTFDAAIDRVKKHIENGNASFDRPLTLSNGAEVTPVIFGRERLALRARQNTYGTQPQNVPA